MWKAWHDRLQYRGEGQTYLRSTKTSKSEGSSKAAQRHLQVKDSRHKVSDFEASFFKARRWNNQVNIVKSYSSDTVWGQRIFDGRWYLTTYQWSRKVVLSRSTVNNFMNCRHADRSSIWRCIAIAIAFTIDFRILDAATRQLGFVKCIVELQMCYNTNGDRHPSVNGNHSDSPT